MEAIGRERASRESAIEPVEGRVTSAPSSRTDPMQPIRSRELSGTLGDLLSIGPQEGFDVRRLNSLRFEAILADVGDDRARARELVERVEQLMARVKQELDDPLHAGTFLRERARDWFLTSSANPDWTSQTVPAWSGIFADSRTAGGQMYRWINIRLDALRDTALRTSSPSSRLRRVVLRDRAADAHVARTAQQQIVAEIAQAILDDLAARPRAAEGPHPMVRLSELAVRRQIPTVNDGLAMLFGSPESGPFVVLHPNRYPDCEELEIRSPVATASGAALAYTLVQGHSARRASGRAGSAESSEAATSQDHLEGNIWEISEVSGANWVELVDVRRKERRRLESPPKEFRQAPAYRPLRELVLGSPEFRKAFLAARWRGRPTGFPLLVGLLQKGSFSPEVATDYEYLEAELSAFAEEDPAGSAAAGLWTFAGWTVRRSGSHAEGFRYEAQAAEQAP